MMSEKERGTVGPGASPPRSDGAGKVTGRAGFVADLDVPGRWYGRAVRVPLPRARVLALDPEPARRADPEIVVVTPRDLPGPNAVRVIEDDWPVLAAREVRHAHEAVALVAAPTAERARLAAERVRVEVEPLPARGDLDAALAAAERGETVRVLAECAVERGDVEAALATADHVVEGLWRTGAQEHVYIEPNGIVAIPREDGSLEVVGSLQCPYYVHGALTHLLGEAPEHVRVRQATTGGGFGGKEEFPDLVAAHAALLARASGRPVAVLYDRHEDLLVSTKRHPSLVRHRTGVDRSGALLAMDIEVVLDGGAYVTLSPVVLSRAVLHAAGPYRCPNVRVRGRVLETNTPPRGAFRGFGAPQVQFACERQLDRIARELGLDPFEIRERNAYRPGDRTPTGQVLDESVSALECLREAERRTGFRRRWRANEARRRAEPSPDRPVEGVGLSLFWHGSGFTGEGELRMRSPVVVRLAEDGCLEVRVSSTDFGQGTTTVLAQVAAGAAGAPLERVRVVQPDTAEVPDSGPTVASRTVMVVGSTVARAAKDLAAAIGADGTPRSFEEAARARLERDGPLEVERRYEPPPGTSFDEATYRGTAYAAFGFGCDVVTVNLDPDTLEVRPLAVTSVVDVGKAIHPVLCAGQVEGGTLQGLAHGWLEDLVHENGVLQNDRLATCLIPTSADAPHCDVVLLEHPAPVGPGGAKGVGELPADGGAPAICAAIENASGICPERIPATPERLLEGLLAGRVVQHPLRPFVAFDPQGAP